MYFRTTIVLAAALALLADTSDVNRYRTPVLAGSPTLGSLPDPGPMPEIYVSVVQQTSGKQAPLQPQSRLEIVRYVSGEFAKVLKPIPAGKKGFKVEVGKKLDENELKTALRSHGQAANPGDTVQVTAIEFRNKEIVVEINGGGRSSFNIRDHLQVGVGQTMQTPLETSGSHKNNGGTLVLDFGRSVPDMSADDLMTDLQVFLDFTKEHSGAVNWLDTLPPQFKEAIQDHQALEGMNHDMVLAALGRPGHKVRERDPDGSETEDWIYGTPPARTTFVTFIGDKVVRVKEFD
ncbi:MAG TPA: hypothetical protein VIH88_04235 [Candidatus Acidoferrales bacterium]